MTAFDKFIKKLYNDPLLETRPATAVYRSAVASGYAPIGVEDEDTPSGEELIPVLEKLGIKYSIEDNFAAFLVFNLGEDNDSVLINEVDKDIPRKNYGSLAFNNEDEPLEFAENHEDLFDSLGYYEPDISAEFGVNYVIFYQDDIPYNIAITD